MPLDAAQITWLKQAAGSGVSLPEPEGGGGKDKAPDGKKTGKELQDALRQKQQEEVVRDEKRKALAIADVNRAIKPLKPVLQDAFDLEVQSKGGTEQLQAKDGDLSKAVESRDIRGSDKIAKSGAPKGQEQDVGKLLQEAKRAYDAILTMRNQLEAMTTTRSRIDPEGNFFDGPPEPLFSTAEIMDEVFTPLVRQKILPETIITDTYSAVQKMLDGSNALYKEELKEQEKEQVSLDLLKKAVDVGSAITGAALSVAGIDPKLAKTMLEGATELVKATIDFGEKLANGVDVKNVTDFLNGLPAVIGPMVGAFAGKEIGQLVSTAGSAGTQGVALIANAIKERKATPSLLIDFVSGVISVGLAQVPTASDKQAKIVELADTLQGALSKIASSHSDAFFEAVFAGDMDKARKEMMGVVKDVVMAMPGTLVKEIKAVTSASDEPKAEKDDKDGEKGDDEEEADPVGESVEAGKETVKSVMETVDQEREKREKLLEALGGEQDEALKKLAEDVDKAAADRKKIEENPEEFAKSVQEALKKEQEEFKKQLEGLGDPFTDDKAIEKLMAKIERDRAIMAVAVAIGKGGIEVASKFFAPLAMGTEAIKMAANIQAAVQRAQDLRKFLEMKTRSKNAVSPYLTSVANFADNQENQLTKYAIRIALNGAAIAAAAAATAFPMAAPAVTAVGLASSGTELLFEVYDEKRLKDAWSLTKQALDDPMNRKLGLRARRLNPTLAKYTVAYGAEIARDPIALSMCQECGLSMDTVANSDAKKIKAYLVLKFEEDGEVLHEYEDAGDWQAELPEPKLDPACVLDTYRVLEGAKQSFKGKASGDFKAPGELVTLVRIAAKPLPGSADAAQMEERLMLLGRLMDGFRGEAAKYAPLGDGAGATIEAFSGLAEVIQGKLVMELLRAKVAAVKGPSK